MKEKDRRHSHWYVSTRWTLAQDRMAESRQSTTTTVTTPDTTSTITTTSTTTTLGDDGKSEKSLGKKLVIGTACVMTGVGTAAAIGVGVATELALKK